MNNDLVEYYAERAKEYEKIYDKPERQGDLKALSNLVQTIFAAKDVFEIACGTGYWTQHIAKTADSVLATDINQAVIDIAETSSLVVFLAVLYGLTLKYKKFLILLKRFIGL